MRLKVVFSKILKIWDSIWYWIFPCHSSQQLMALLNLLSVTSKFKLKKCLAKLKSFRIDLDLIPWLQFLQIQSCKNLKCLIILLNLPLQSSPKQSRTSASIRQHEPLMYVSPKRTKYVTMSPQILRNQLQIQKDGNEVEVKSEPIAILSSQVKRCLTQWFRISGRFPVPGVDFINCFASYLRLAPNFWEAFYWRKSSVQGANKAQNSNEINPSSNRAPKIQWGSEYWTSLVFKWSKVVRKLNGLLFERWSENRTILVCYSNSDLNSKQFIHYFLARCHRNRASEYWMIWTKDF